MSETVRILVSVFGKVGEPTIIEGELSSSGKTISAEYIDTDFRLKTDKILSGDTEYRDKNSLCFELYTKERYLAKYNEAKESIFPIFPKAVSEEKTKADIPEPTHTVDGYEQESLTAY